MLHNLFQFGFAGLAGICLLGALLRRAHRGSFFTAAISAGAAAVAAHFGVFWALTVFGLGVVWALFTATSYIDLAWRAKTGLVLFLALGAAVCIYPTAHDETQGADDHAKLSSDERSELETAQRNGDKGFGAFLRSNIPFRLVRGLDLKGGLRLVYTVDVDEAIKDKRDRYYDEIRAALTTALGFHTGDKAPSVEELSKLPTKVQVAKSKDQAGTITLTFKDVADAKKVDDAFLKRFLTELQLQRSADQKTLTFRLRSEKESEIREHAVTQAKGLCQRMQTRFLRAAADEQQHGARGFGGVGGETPQQECQPLVVIKRADEAHDCAAVQTELFGQGGVGCAGAGETCQVHGIGRHRDMRGIDAAGGDFLAQRLADGGDPVSTAQHPAFHRAGQPIAHIALAGGAVIDRGVFP